MRHYHFVLPALLYFITQMFSCGPGDSTYTIAVSNGIGVTRQAETIEIPLESVVDFSKEQYRYLAIEDDSGRKIATQLIDTDQDSINDLLIFQADFEARQTKEFRLTGGKTAITEIERQKRTFCRMVPERMDDFAWENDKVAFRTYGPRCQELYEQGNPAGLISSGMDCWTKSVDYPIIDKWYREDKNGKSYHEDHGEGLDAYHVGTTRGCGGTALVQENSYVLSENFITSRVLANGPIRSIFELEYSPVQIGENTVTERKRITLDLGSNLYYCEVSYISGKPLDSAAVGIALHQSNGKIASNIEEGWVTYWEPFMDSYLGIAVLAGPESLTSLSAKDTLHQDESRNNIWAHMKVEENNFSYWAGFGWQKRGEFGSSRDWESHLGKEASKKHNPVEVKINKD
ncbi:DUF4861 domain-containing protein [Fulvivirga sp. M361]|uniref:DUF4861 family protein n=1 Tax=Fulvivirga sp. M361 TaxID=2594266 RepID=UPI00117AD76F|nr:DUF4861 family protein [Fulvivirga sp. M361]TRX47326.1 DUF4861 domain-containing protein [Fulvivirga sp. M361]